MKYDYQTADPSLYHILHDFAAYNRNHPTEAESLLWEYLRSRQLGVAFKRQHIIGDYIADFACIPLKLVIELDGRHHQLPKQQIRDEERTKWLNDRGFQVVRFTNDELFNDIDNVLETIKKNII